MKINYVLIDFESVQVTSLALLKDEEFHVRVFLGPNNKGVHRDLVLAMHKMKERGEYIELDAPGKNALDFYITYYLGEFAAKDPHGNFIIISKDKGFDSLISHLKTKNITCSRFPSIDLIPGIKPKPRVPVVKSKAPVTTSQNSTIEGLVKTAVTDLIKRKAAKPRTTKTLINTIRNSSGKNQPQSIIDKVYATLLKQGYVKVDGVKVTYNLPSV